MKIKSIDDITPDFLSKEAEASSSVKTFLSEELSKQSQDFVDKLKVEQEAKEGFETKFSEASDAVAALTAEVEKLKGEAAEREKKEIFKTRMEEIASEFVLDEKQKKAIASDLSEVESDEAYSKLKTRLELFASKTADIKKEEKENSASDLKDLKESQASAHDIPNSKKYEEKDEDLVSVLINTISLRK